MAKILIQGERATAEVLDVNADSDDDDSEPRYVFRCEYGHEDTDRGNFEDTVQAAEIHVDYQCTGPSSGA